MISGNFQQILLSAALGLCALSASGCAGLGLPRIDPSGERVFVWPRDQVPAVAPARGNLRAAPLFTEPVFPQPILPVQGARVALAPQLGTGLLPPVPQDRLSITPDRVLAPVGSEVILKAGLCTRDSFLLTDSKVDWLLARDGAGEFVSLGGRGWCRDPWLPWNKSKKIDNQYGIGYTAKVPLLITRGTAAPSDDLQIEPGEAWASVTSPVEGTSRITVVAPEIETWANRRATATIYWVDVQWTFPPPAISAGSSQVLTTTVLRQTDGTPIEGWLVRYEVADGTGALRGSESGQVVEVPTDATGRASIDVTPTGSSGNTTQINTQIVRPERFAGSNAPRLVIAGGACRVNWTDAGSDYLPPPDNLDGPTPTYPIPGEGSTPPPSSTIDSRRGPVLELEVHDANDNTAVLVGGEARFKVVIRNVGDSPATGVVLRDVFDQGLTHPSAGPGDFEIENTKIGDIGPGDSKTLFLTFGVVSAGRLRQVLTATSSEGAFAERQALVDVQQPVVQPQGRLEVTKRGPRMQIVGETALFTLSIRNIGDAPLTNIEVVDTYDRELQPKPSPGAEIRSGSLFWSIERLEVGDSWRQDVRCQCLAPKLEACGTVSVTADTGTAAPALSTAKASCLEIRPGRDVVPGVVPAPGGDVLPGVTPPANSGTAPAGPNATGALNMELLLFANPVRAGTQQTFQIVIGNNSSTPDQQVHLRVLFPPELTPDVTAIQTDAGVQWQFKNGELLFAPIAELRPEEKLEFTIPYNVNQPGVRNLTAELISQNMPQRIQQTRQINILGR